MRCCLGYCVVPDRSSVRCFARAKRLAGKIYSDITCNITSLTAQYALTYALTLDLPLAACWNTCRLRIHSVSIIAYRCNCDGKQCESKNKNPPPLRPAIFWHFSKRLGIFNQFFTHLLHVSVYARGQIFIQLCPTLTKLCYTKCETTHRIFYISLELNF